MPGQMPAVSHKLQVRGVNKRYLLNGVRLDVLWDVNLHADDGEFVSIIGPSGCGKSTLFNIIAGLIAPSEGEALLGPDGIRPALGAVGYMPQKDLLLPWHTVLDNAVMGLELAGVASAEARERALTYLDEFGLAGFEHSRPQALSGGMRQRVAFLRTLLPEQEILLLDEPFGALDALTRSEMQEWLLKVWGAHRRTVLFVTHDVDEALFLSDRVYVMTGRPGTIKAEIEVGLPRPRTMEAASSPRYVGLRAQLMASLREEGRRQTVGQPEMPAPGVQRGLAAGTRPVARAAASPLAERRPAAGWARWAALDYGAPLALAALGIALWQMATAVFDVPTWQLPAPSGVAEKLVDEAGLLARHAWVTLREVLLGFLMALGAGVLLAVGIAYSKILGRALYPYVIASQTVPIIAIAPMLVIWLGFGLMPKIVVVALISFFPIVVNTVDGLHSVELDLVNLMRSLGASRWQIFRKVQMPSALPYLFSGIRVAVAVSVIGAVIGEWVGASEGLGYLITRSSSQFLTERMFAAMAILAAMGIGLFALVTRLERLLIPWYRSEERAARRN